MSSKIGSLLTVKPPTDVKKVLELDITALKGCDEDIAKILNENKITKISDLVKIPNADKIAKTIETSKLEMLTTAARMINDVATGERTTDKKIVRVRYSVGDETAVELEKIVRSFIKKHL